MKDNKTFCILPWVHTHLNTEGDVYPCCVSWTPERKSQMGWLKDNSLEEIFNSPKMRQLRLDMMNGVERPDICSNCYDREDAGFASARQGNNRDFDDQIEELVAQTREDGYIDPKIKSWDIRFSNLCNLKCRSCGPMFSTSWAQEKGELGKIYAIPSGTDPLANQYDTVEKIYFAGGEPLIMPEHFRTLTKLIDIGRAGEIMLVYNSNMTKLDYNNHNLTDYWKHFKKVVIGVSLDNIGTRAEYTRSGTNWEILDKNLKAFYHYVKTHKNISFYYSPTISIFNIHQITDIHRYLYENNMMQWINSILFNILLQPEYYDCRILPIEVKEEVVSKLKEHIDWLRTVPNADSSSIDQFVNLIDYVMQEVDHERLQKAFKIETIKMDNIRKESFVDIFPEHAEWYNKINV